MKYKAVYFPLSSPSNPAPCNCIRFQIHSIQHTTQTAQSVQNTPKQHIASKAPTDEATAGGGGGEGEGYLESGSVVPGLSCNIAEGLKRWRGGTKSRLLSSGSSRGVHIRPWESAVPIHPSAAGAGSCLNNMGPAYSQQQSSCFPQPFRGNDGICSDEAALLSPPKFYNAEVERRGESRTIRPATAGAIRTRATGSHAGGCTGDSGGRNPMSEMHSSSSMGATKALGVVAPQRGRGGGAVATTRGGLLSSASDHKLPSTRPEDRQRRERVATWRVFDSTAAEWVQTAVLQHAASRRARDFHEWRRASVVAARRPQRTMVGNSSLATAGAAEHGEDADASLTTEAKSAIEEVFDRYDHRSSAARRGFLLSTEISALQGIWTRPDETPPLPRQQTPASSSALLKRPRRKSPQTYATTSTSRGVPSTGGVSPPLEVSEVRENEDHRDTRVLTRAAFVEFCRRAAARDAIFIRHFFTRSGYNYRLELRLPAPRDNATTANTTPEPPQVAHSSSAHSRQRSFVSERRRPDHRQTVGNNDLGGGGRIHPRRDGSLVRVGRGGVGRGTETPTSNSAFRSQERGLFQYENDEVRGLVSGGIVDPAELWLWTDDRRDHGGRQELDGLLSRGGGAHISRAVTATAAIVGAFATTKRPDSATGIKSPVSVSSPEAQGLDVLQQPEVRPPTDEGVADDTGTTGTSLIKQAPAPECGRTLVGHEASSACRSQSKVAEHKAQADERTGPQCGRIVPRTTAVNGDVLHAGLGVGSTVAGGGVSATCEWCGGVVVVGGKERATAAVHSAAFCDEEVLRVQRIR